MDGDGAGGPAGEDLVETAADELYRTPREEFVDRRLELVRAARAAGDRDAATAIGALRKPTVAAWLANALAREHAGEVGALAELGTSLREAQDRLEGDELRALTRQRHQLVTALVGRARRLAAPAGVRVGVGVERELERTVGAALADPAAARALAAGRLVGPLEPGDGLGTATAPATSPTPSATTGTGTGRGTGDRRDRPAARSEHAEQERAERERAERERAERTLAAAEAELEAADAARDRARTAAGEADAARDAATAAVADLRDRLAAAEDDERAAHDRVSAAHRERAEREDAARAAVAARDGARRALDPSDGA